mmetsp:Transcript_9147/g.25533  ORF Transcript_9147/g.25533 Transcript_9147/m.25533 type:complete len:319 (+) Transcript_9147:2360-3316(+)
MTERLPQLEHQLQDVRVHRERLTARDERVKLRLRILEECIIEVSLCRRQFKPHRVDVLRWQCQEMLSSQRIFGGLGPSDHGWLHDSAGGIKRLNHGSCIVSLEWQRDGLPPHGPSAPRVDLQKPNERVQLIDVVLHRCSGDSPAAERSQIEHRLGHLTTPILDVVGLVKDHTLPIDLEYRRIRFFIANGGVGRHHHAVTAQLLDCSLAPRTVMLMHRWTQVRKHVSLDFVGPLRQERYGSDDKRPAKFVLRCRLLHERCDMRASRGRTLDGSFLGKRSPRSSSRGFNTRSAIQSQECKTHHCLSKTHVVSKDAASTQS